MVSLSRRGYFLFRLNDFYTVSNSIMWDFWYDHSLYNSFELITVFHHNQIAYSESNHKITILHFFSMLLVNIQEFLQHIFLIRKYCFSGGEFWKFSHNVFYSFCGFKSLRFLLNINDHFGIITGMSQTLYQELIT